MCKFLLLLMLQTEITDFKEKLQLARETISKFKTEIVKVQKEKGVDSSVNSIIYSTP